MNRHIFMPEKSFSILGKQNKKAIVIYENVPREIFQDRKAKCHQYILGSQILNRIHDVHMMRRMNDELSYFVIEIRYEIPELTFPQKASKPKR